jgi:hypothetical protein
MKAWDRTLSGLQVNIFDPGFLGHVRRNGTAGCLFYGQGGSDVIGMRMGQDEQRNILGPPSRFPEIIENELLRGCDSAIDETDLLAID